MAMFEKSKWKRLHIEKKAKLFKSGYKEFYLGHPEIEIYFIETEHNSNLVTVFGFITKKERPISFSRNKMTGENVTIQTINYVLTECLKIVNS